MKKLPTVELSKFFAKYCIHVYFKKKVHFLLYKLAFLQTKKIYFFVSTFIKKNPTCTTVFTCLYIQYTVYQIFSAS